MCALWKILDSKELLGLPQHTTVAVYSSPLFNLVSANCDSVLSQIKIFTLISAVRTLLHGSCRICIR